LDSVASVRRYHFKLVSAFSFCFFGLILLKFMRNLNAIQKSSGYAAVQISA
jgi:hypothetical protein